jgi:hypothetical protein
MPAEDSIVVPNQAPYSTNTVEKAMLNEDPMWRSRNVFEAYLSYACGAGTTKQSRPTPDVGKGTQTQRWRINLLNPALFCRAYNLMEGQITQFRAMKWACTATE